MRETAQLWIGASNREESIAHVLSRAGFCEGTVLHAHRAATSAFRAVFANHGWAATSDRCADLCAALGAHDITAPQDVASAASGLDADAGLLDIEATRRAPAELCTAQLAADALDRARRIRSFVNAVLTKR